jgi:hypothetical protein
MKGRLGQWRWRLQQQIGPIPKGTLVDPDAFPEDEYPVWCLQCGVQLHGKVAGRCPECNTPFHRGTLLVEIYARGRLVKRWRRRLLFTHLATVGSMVALITIFGIWATHNSVAARASHVTIGMLGLLAVFPVIINLASLAIYRRTALPVHKCDKVRRAACAEAYRDA